jgi:hypothetical protein
MMNEYPMIHSEHLAKADESYEIRFDQNGHAIHVYFKDGYAIVFPALHEFVLRVYYGEEVERFYLDEEDLERMYQERTCNYYELKARYALSS